MALPIIRVKPNSTISRNKNAQKSAVMIEIKNKAAAMAAALKMNSISFISLEVLSCTSPSNMGVRAVGCLLKVVNQSILKN